MERVDLSKTGSAGSSPGSAKLRLGTWGVLAFLGLAACNAAPVPTIVADSGVTGVAAEVARTGGLFAEPRVVALPDVEAPVEPVEPARSARGAKTVVAPTPRHLPKPAPLDVDPYADEAGDDAAGEAPPPVVVSLPAPASVAPSPAPTSAWIAPEVPEPLVPRAPRRDARSGSIRVSTPVVFAASVGAGGLVVAAAAATMTPSDQTTGFALGALGIGAVGLGTAGLLLLLGADDAPPPRSPDPVLVKPRVTSASVGPGSVAVAGRF